MFVQRYQQLFQLIVLVTIVLFVFYGGRSSRPTRKNISDLQSSKEVVSRIANDLNTDNNGSIDVYLSTSTVIPEEGNHTHFTANMKEETTTAELDVVQRNPPKHLTTDANFRADSDRQTRYLFPTKTIFSGGSNSQYNHFKRAVIFAVLTNRTLVMTPFYLHGGHVRGLTLEHMRSFNNTFDVDILEELLPLATVDQFKQACNSYNIKMTGWDIYTGTYEATRISLYHDKIGVDLPPLDTAVEFKKGITLDKVISETGSFDCLALSVDSALQLQIGQEMIHDVKTAVAKNMVRTPMVRNIVDSMSDSLCHGEHYLALHWRNKSAEMPCFFERGKRRNECSSILKEIRKLAEIATVVLYDLMNQENIKCIYVACPLWSMEIVDVLSKRIRRDDIISSRDLDIPEKDRNFLSDYYMLSLVEQEIAFRAAIFVSAGHSNWSQFVAEGREAVGRTTYNIRELAGIPDDVDMRLI